MCPGLAGVGLLDDRGPLPRGDHQPCAQEVSTGVRRKVLDLVAAGRGVAQVATDLDISEQTIYVWRRQELIDTGQLPGTTSIENAELMAARRRIAELEPRADADTPAGARAVGVLRHVIVSANAAATLGYSGHRCGRRAFESWFFVTQSASLIGS